MNISIILKPLNPGNNDARLAALSSSVHSRVRAMEYEVPNIETQSHCIRSSEDEHLVKEVEVTLNTKRDSKCSRYSITIEPLMFVVVLSDILLGPVNTNFVLEKSCEIHFQLNKSVCSILSKTNQNNTELEALVQPYAAMILTGMNLLAVCFPAVMSLFLGAWSDCNGRKLLLIVPSVGFSLKYLLLAIFSLIPSIHPTFLFISVLPAALTGGFVNFLFGAYSYICDISSENNRYIRVTVLESAMIAGAIAGSLSSGPLFRIDEKYCYFIPFILCFAIVFLVTIFSYFFVPERVRNEDRKKFFHVFNIKYINEMFRICCKKRENYGRAVIILVIISLTATVSAMEGEGNIRYLFARLKFGWNIEKYAEWISITCAINFIGILLGSVFLIKFLKLSNSTAAIISYVMNVASDLYIAFIPSNSSYMMYYTGLIKLFSGLDCPSGKALQSQIVPKEDLGKVFALSTFCESVFSLAITPLYTLLYKATLKTLPTAIFFLSASFHTGSLILFLVIYFIERNAAKTRYTEIAEENDVQ